MIPSHCQSGASHTSSFIHSFHILHHRHDDDEHMKQMKQKLIITKDKPYTIRKKSINEPHIIEGYNQEQSNLYDSFINPSPI